MAEYSIGVDLGGTNLRAAAVDRNGKILEKHSQSTDMTRGRDEVIDDIVSGINTVRQKIGSASRLAGVGIGVPGFILIEKGYITNSNNLPVLENFPLRDEIERRLGAPIILENDANAAALGEKWMGAGKDVDNLVLLTLGTGIGGGIISEGRVLHGEVGMAAELGHITIDPNGNPCGCGNFGCLEKIASATAVEAMSDLMSVGVHLTSLQVYEKAVEGDEKAKMIFRQMGWALGVGIANLINIFNYPLYLLSGGMLPAWDMFAPFMLEEIRRRSFTFRNTQTRVERATLGNQAGLIGAAYLPFLSQKL